jgi:pimeloyl-ACP methyl ester carboxylesterase
MWLPLLTKLSTSNTVIAPALRGAGSSERTTAGYDKKTLATDIRGLVRQLGYREPVHVVGHDIGLMVAYAYAAQYPTEVTRQVLIDAFLPGIGDWQTTGNEVHLPRCRRPGQRQVGHRVRGAEGGRQPRSRSTAVRFLPRAPPGASRLPGRLSAQAATLRIPRAN